MAYETVCQWCQKFGPAYVIRYGVTARHIRSIVRAAG